MQKLKLDLTLLAVESFDAASPAYSEMTGHCSNCRECGSDEGSIFAHQNDTMPDPDAPDRKTQKEQQRDPDLQSYTSGGGGGAAADPEQNLIIEDDPRYAKPADNPGYVPPSE